MMAKRDSILIVAGVAIGIVIAVALMRGSMSSLPGPVPFRTPWFSGAKLPYPRSTTILPEGS